MILLQYDYKTCKLWVSYEKIWQPVNDFVGYDKHLFNELIKYFKEHNYDWENINYQIHDIVIKSIISALNVIGNEELKKEYHYIRKLIIVSIFLKHLPLLFNNDYIKMKKFLYQNKLPTNIYDNIYKYNNM